MRTCGTLLIGLALLCWAPVLFVAGFQQSAGCVALFGGLALLAHVLGARAPREVRA